MMQKSDIEKYFNAEKGESIIFILLGCAAILLAAGLLYYLRTSYAKGMAIPLIAIALIQITVGYVVYRKSDGQRTDMVYALDMDPGRLKSEEIPRMEIVMRNFVYYRWVEIILLASGLLLCWIFYAKTEHSFYIGIGAGLALQSLIMLIADGFAEYRGRIYLDGLRSLFS